MNEKEICFIICGNNRLYEEECVYYIKHLKVPESYQISVLVIEGAKSMTAGYNKAMHSSKAKYKVYLHQDTFIINPDFIQDFLDVFQSDEQIGMIGMVGSPKLPDNGVMWDGERCGALCCWDIHSTEEYWFPCKMEDQPAEVEVIDGMLMITQYDIPWREDLFDKWDFYDCSQSQEFIRRGYKVVVPKMEKPWCLHDTAMANLSAYYGECEKFLNEYRRNQEDKGYKATVVLTTYNRKEILEDTLKWLENVNGVSNIIILDNGSMDGTGEWLAEQTYDYIYFEEGTQGYGKLWNAALENFETEDYIVFLEAGIYPGKDALMQLMNALRPKEVGIASPVLNCDFSQGNAVEINNKDEFLKIQQNVPKNSAKAACDKTLTAEWKIWAVRKEVFIKNGYFREEIKHPENVLLDYELRLIKNDFYQQRLHVCAYDNVHPCDEIYVEAVQWDIEDIKELKNVWGINYLNLEYFSLYVLECIQEEKEKEFNVLEVGCNLGTELFAIQTRYPNCRTYGLEINEAAVNVAKHLADVRYGDIDELKVPFTEKFDYIIFGDVLEHLRHPKEVIEMCHNILKEDGYIIASIPNIMHISVMEELIDGRFIYEDAGLLDRTHIHFFTYYEILQMFMETHYRMVEMRTSRMEISDKQKELEKKLLALSEHTEEFMYEVVQYIVKMQRI